MKVDPNHFFYTNQLILDMIQLGQVHDNAGLCHELSCYNYHPVIKASLTFLLDSKEWPIVP